MSQYKNTKTTPSTHVIEKQREKHHLNSDILLKNQYNANNALYTKNLFSTTKPQHEKHPIPRDHKRNPGMR